MTRTLDAAAVPALLLAGAVVTGLAPGCAPREETPPTECPAVDSGTPSSPRDAGNDEPARPDAGAPEVPLGALPVRGASAGSLADVNARRDAFDRASPMERGNGDTATYSARAQPALLTVEQARPDRVLPGRAVPTGTPSQRVSWNSYGGRQLAGPRVRTEYVSNWPIPTGRTPCVTPAPMGDCCSYELTDGAEGSTAKQIYYAPKDHFDSGASAHTALREVFATRPLLLPFTDPEVVLINGWIYEGPERKAHGSLDYWKVVSAGEDPAFAVRAVAPGTVISRYWDSWHGNVLVLEHPAPGGFTYRSFYFHLRDGKSHDVSMAKSKTVPTGDVEDSRDKYKLYANAPEHLDLQWGTEEQAIPVSVGDTVAAHQLIAWSGNTGPGGAGAGLTDAGVPRNPVGANNHLHFMLAVRHAQWTGGKWVYVDPYGVYEQASTGCYDLLQDTQYDRLFAPYRPAFHGVDVDVYTYYAWYYGQMGYSPASLSVERTEGGRVVAAGHFAQGLSPDWYAYVYARDSWLSGAEAPILDGGYGAQQVEVTLDGQGTPRHSVIYRPADGGVLALRGEPLVLHQGIFNKQADAGFRLADFAGYTEGSIDRASVVFRQDVPDVVHHFGLSGAAYKALVEGPLLSSGWMPVDLHVTELADGVTLAGTWQQTGDARMVHWGMDGPEYQQWFNFYAKEGWTLHTVQTYQRGTRYAAIWRK